MFLSKLVESLPVPICLSFALRSCILTRTDLANFPVLKTTTEFDLLMIHSDDGLAGRPLGHEMRIPRGFATTDSIHTANQKCRRCSGPIALTLWKLSRAVMKKKTGHSKLNNEDEQAVQSFRFTFQRESLPMSFFFFLGYL